MKRKLFLPILAILCAALLGGCGDSESKAPKKSTSKPKVEKTQPLSVSIYLDNSSSMRGYYAPTKGSAIDLSKILAAIESRYLNTPIRAFYTQKGAKGTEVKEYDFTTLSSQLATKKLGYTDAFQLDQFITAIRQQAEADSTHLTLSFFITDGILSGTDAEISANREFNKVNAPLLRNRIAKAIAPLANKGNSVAVLEFEVDFDGTYYDYANRKSQFTGERPIYVIVIGPTKEVAEFAHQAEGGSLKDIDPEHTLLIAKSSTDIVPNFSNCQRKGNIYTAKPKKANVKGAGAKALATLRLTFPVDKLPSYMADEDAIRNAVLVSVDGQEVPKSSIKLNGDKVVVPIDAKYGKTKVTLQVKNAMPGWVDEVNTDDDSKIAATDEQTFNFSNLIDGLCQGVFESSSNDVVAAKTYTIDWDGKTE